MFKDHERSGFSSSVVWFIRNSHSGVYRKWATIQVFWLGRRNPDYKGWYISQTWRIHKHFFKESNNQNPLPPKSEYNYLKAFMRTIPSPLSLPTPHSTQHTSKICSVRLGDSSEQSLKGAQVERRETRSPIGQADFHCTGKLTPLEVAQSIVSMAYTIILISAAPKYSRSESIFLVSESFHWFSPTP